LSDTAAETDRKLGTLIDRLETIVAGGFVGGDDSDSENEGEGDDLIDAINAGNPITLASHNFMNMDINLFESIVTNTENTSGTSAHNDVSGREETVRLSKNFTSLVRLLKMLDTHKKYLRERKNVTYDMERIKILSGLISGIMASTQEQLKRLK